MKKLLILTICALFIGCTNEEVNNEVTTTTTTTTTTVPAYVDDNPIQLGLYQYFNSNTDRLLVSNYEKNFPSETDIGSFEVFYTRDNNISGGTFQTIWKEYFNKYENIDKYKIGFNIKFSTKDGKNYDQTILKPNDANVFYDYLQIYLYDDVHQEIGKWYSHVENDKVTDETIFSSIKLTNSYDADKMNDEIILTVFAYDDDDFDLNGKYRGNCFYTINIKNVKSNG